jgi:hypothetical protein
MKTFRMIGMALIAVLVCENLTSCSKEDIPQYEIITTGKKIKKITMRDSFLGESFVRYAEYDFKYDDTGKLIEITHNYGDDVHKYDYVWSSDAVNSYTLKDGLIRSCGDRNVRYSVEKPVEIRPQSSVCTYYEIVWSDNNDGLSRMGTYYYEVNRGKLKRSLRFSYDEKSMTCNNYNPIVPIVLSEGFNQDLLCVAHPELVNARTNELPTKFILEFPGSISKPIQGICSYGFDNDGYVVYFSMMDYDSWDTHTATYDITWE